MHCYYIYISTASLYIDTFSLSHNDSIVILNELIHHLRPTVYLLYVVYIYSSAGAYYTCMYCAINDHDQLITS